MYVCTVDRAFISRVSSELWGCPSRSSESWMLNWWMTRGLYGTKKCEWKSKHEKILQQANVQTELKWEDWWYRCICCRGGACPVAPGSWPALLLWTNTWSLLLVVDAAAAAAAAGRFSSSLMGKRPGTRLGWFLWSYLLGSSERLPWDLGEISKLSVYMKSQRVRGNKLS